MPKNKANKDQKPPVEPNVNENVGQNEPESASVNDVAVVMEGRKEVRRFSLQQHGEDFIDLAHQYADRRGLKIELISMGEGVSCPHCNKVFFPNLTHDIK